MLKNESQEPLSIIIPSYNDAAGLAKILPQLITQTDQAGWRIIIVNDGSTDDTSDVLEKYSSQITVVTNHENMGYGASLKRGIFAAETEWVACMDADGQHRYEDLAKMALLRDDMDAIIGERVTASHAPVSRRPGKWLLLFLSRLITGRRIKDLNCGLRIMRRSIVISLFPVTSNRFSFSTSTTVSFLQMGCRVLFVPVLAEKRVGKSSVRQVRDGLDAVLRIVRLVFLFNPLRVVLPIGLLFLLAGFAGCFHDVLLTTPPHITSSSLLLSITGVIVVFMALLSDQVSGLRRDLLVKEITQRQMQQPLNRQENN